ncbi:non-hydrolyzing UDP-N-acetylglucosamine 2-epimerase [Haladaptatus sp. NG-SE-30]
MIVLGTRPEIIKLSSVIRRFDESDVLYEVVHTGQHYSDEMNDVFFNQLDIPRPDHNLRVGSNSHGQQTADILANIEDLLVSRAPDLVLVQGDTNSVLGSAIATSKLDVELGHVEAGLRSYEDIPEETNRRVTDHVADYLFAPTTRAKQNLRREGVPEDRIFVTGNTVVDGIRQHIEIAAEKSTVLADLDVTDTGYAVMTAHRAENVDDPDRFAKLLDGAVRVADEFGLPVLYPIHPRAEKQYERMAVELPPEVRLMDPLDYLDFLQLERHAEIILTDSGGVQEEACVLGVPCVTMREHTERPETLTVGANYLAGVSAEAISEGVETMLRRPNAWENPFGDGTAAEQIYDVVTDPREVVA